MIIRSILLRILKLNLNRPLRYLWQGEEDGLSVFLFNSIDPFIEIIFFLFFFSFSLVVLARPIQKLIDNPK